ncbi:aminoglycoside phosphotransferase family protein [Halobacillus litoralis]|uniref:aminoglycoside phosphotransferase family protein n=1 Tax=Halobacillus litoralis TaxID=45668 RepID=UPI001CD287B4|nr:aminoglycoside phosphotransferase family protein [Halobacillus litoralis]MCA0969298.1 aminoglycoside phosphotransferase family protein [Halobacillus litoralis]
MLEVEQLISKQLGENVRFIEPVDGGLLHRMYQIRTDNGHYAVKWINPTVIARPEAMQNYIDSERIADVASSKIPALPALRIQGNALLEHDGDSFLVFHWVEGRTLKAKDVTNHHCRKMGQILADLHGVDFSNLTIEHPSEAAPSMIAWQDYRKQSVLNKMPWAELMDRYADKLQDWNLAALNAHPLLSSNQVISHRDMDLKNVMWKEGQPLIIDWESAGFIHPVQDLLETAMYWSENVDGIPQEDRFLSFLDGYGTIPGVNQVHFEVVLQAIFLGKLSWLEYNLKRAIGMEATDASDREMGETQVFETFDDLQRFNDSIPRLLSWCYQHEK